MRSDVRRAEKKPENKRNALLVLCIVLAAVLAVGLISVGAAMLDPYDGRIQEDVTIGGLPVGGMSKAEARKVLEDTLEKTLLGRNLTVEVLGGTLTLTVEDMGLKVDTTQAVRDAYRVGRRENAAQTALDLGAYLKWNETHLRSALMEFAQRRDTYLLQPSWKLVGKAPELSTETWDGSKAAQTLTLTKGVPEQHLDVEAVTQQIWEFYSKAIAFNPEGEYRLYLESEPEELPQELDLEEIYRQCAVAAVDDSLDMQTYEIVCGSYGYHFDLEAAKAALDDAQYGQTVSIPMVYQTPEILGEGVYFRDVLGSCETKHTDDENRNTNLRLVCQFLDGYVIQPGEEFSYNMVVGERTEERGFKPATVFSGSHKTKDFGGGVCQGSTTLYNCLLLADMEILERNGHGAVVTYVPLGLDAAVNWATETDLIFRNNSHFPVKIQAEVSEGYMKMKLLGTDEKDYYIKLEANRWEEGDYYYATSYKCKYDKETDEQISRDFIVRSSYIKKLG